MATLAVLTAPTPTARPSWQVRIARDGGGPDLIIGTGPHRDDAILDALLTLDEFTDLLRHTLGVLPVGREARG